MAVSVSVAGVGGRIDMNEFQGKYSCITEMCIHNLRTGLCRLNSILIEYHQCHQYEKIINYDRLKDLEDQVDNLKIDIENK